MLSDHAVLIAVQLGFVGHGRAWCNSNETTAEVFSHEICEACESPKSADPPKKQHPSEEQG